MIARGLVVLSALVALPQPARAQIAITDFSAPAPTLVERHRKAAEAARRAGDLERAAAELVFTCSTALYAIAGPIDPACAAAQTAVTPYPYLASRLAAQWSCAAAWTLDWKRARELAALAVQLGAGGPAADTLAGDGPRVAHLCIGAAAIEEAKYAEAERELATFLELSERAGDRWNTIVGHTWTCRLALVYADYPRARRHCARAEQLAAAAPVLEHAVPMIAWQHGLVEVDRDARVAAAMWERGLAVAEIVGAPFLAAALRMELADIYLKLGRHADAERLVDAIARSTLPDSYPLQVALVRGRLAAARGDHEAALAQYDIAANSPVSTVVLAALVGRAWSLGMLGRLADARGALREAASRIERARASTTGDEQRRAYLDTKVEVFRALALVEAAIPEPELGERVLAAAEAGRARSMFDAIHAAGIEAPGLAPRSPAEIRAALPADTTLVVYVTGFDRALAVRIDRAGIAVIPLPGAGARAALGERVRYFSELVSVARSAGDLDEVGHALYRDLVAPVIGDRPSGTLWIAADGPLHALPFDALRTGDTYLAERVDVGFVLSGSLATTPSAQRPAASRELLAVAAPILPPELPALPASAAEITEIATGLEAAPTTLVGASATKQAVLAAPGSYRVLHFATHAIVDPVIPLRSGLALTAPAREDGQLRANEIYKLQLAADLVVLSACRTGDGQASSSEGPLSLARAFLYAGARSVVATLWDVHDRHGVAIMGELYRRLAGEHTIGASLAAAKRAAIARHEPPAAWAAYVTIGHTEVVPRLTPARDRWGLGVLAYALAIAGVLAVGAGTWLLRTPRSA